MKDQNLTAKAKQLALQFILRDTSRGISESDISSTLGGRSGSDETFGRYHVSIGGGYSFGPDGKARITAPSSQVIVHTVCGETADLLYSLHDLYKECLQREGQTVLL